jgi:hypothetical protein
MFTTNKHLHRTSSQERLYRNETDRRGSEPKKLSYKARVVVQGERTRIRFSVEENKRYDFDKE